MQPVYAYVIAVKDGAEIKSPVKVGIAAAPEKRIRELQTACPYDITIVQQFMLPNREIAAAMEGCFHHMEASRRTRGEWFDIAPIEAANLMAVYIRWSLSLLTSLSDDEQDAAFAICCGGAK